MKIGDYIKIKPNGKYSGQGMKWTENLLSTETTFEPMILFHSAEEKMTEFRTKQTCFHEGYAIRGHVYALELPAGIEIERYQGREVRVELTEGMKIRYLGQMTCDYIPNGRTVKEIAKYSLLLKSYLNKEEYHWTTI